MDENILVPLDGSEYSKRALEAAIEIAKSFRGKITLIHVCSLSFIIPLYIFENEDVTPLTASSEISKLTDELRDAGAKFLAQGKKSVEAEDIPVETMLREGHIVQEIVTAAREGEFDLIVIGAKGRSKIKEILLGSICEKVVRNAPCNVMVVK